MKLIVIFGNVNNLKRTHKKITNIFKLKDDLRKFDKNEIYDQMKFYELCFNFKGEHAHWSYIHHCKIISEFSAQANILFYKFYNNTTVINFYFSTQQFPNLKVKTCHRNFYTVKKLSFLACCRYLFRGNFCVVSKTWNAKVRRLYCLLRFMSNAFMLTRRLNLRKSTEELDSSNIHLRIILYLVEDSLIERG